MSIPRRHPIVEVGDAGAGVGSVGFKLGHYSAWRVDGIRDEVSDRGALYVSFVANGANVDMTVYRDRERTVPVAEILNAPVNARVEAAPVLLGGLSTRLTVSAIVESNRSSAGVILWVQLATLEDVKEREDDVISFFQGTSAICKFDVIARANMRQLYLNIQSIFPPPQRASAPLSLHGQGPTTVAGRKGLPDVDAEDFWSLNPEGDWELVGLQNVSDFKEWAIAWSLGLIWKRRAGSADDPVLKRSQLYFDEAADQWALLPFLVDFTGDGKPERQVRRSSTLISRG